MIVIIIFIYKLHFFIRYIEEICFREGIVVVTLRYYSGTDNIKLNSVEASRSYSVIDNKDSLILPISCHGVPIVSFHLSVFH